MRTALILTSRVGHSLSPTRYAKKGTKTLAMGSAKDAAIYRFGQGNLLYIQIGDITRWSGDAIVNAANEAMLGGGGVDGAIHDAAGPELYQACKKEPESSPGVRCPTGEARITEGFKLPAKYVIHTVGPVYDNKEESEPKLRSAYKNCLEIAQKRRLKSMAFPAISCGVYGYPLKEAASVALEVCQESSGTLDISFVLFNNKVFQAFHDTAEKCEWLEPVESA